MTRMTEVVAQLLAREEREVVLGDLAEAGESAWLGLLDVLSLVIRRQLALWVDLRPWLAGFGLALPGSLTLMGISVSIAIACQHYVGGGIFSLAEPAAAAGLVPLFCQAFLLLACSWTGGFVAGSISRRTLWVSVALSCSPCLFCLARFRSESLSPLCLLLFLPPAILGVRHGLRTLPVRRSLAMALAAAMTLSMMALWSSGFRILDCVLLWPAWYLAATSGRIKSTPERSDT